MRDIILKRLKKLSNKKYKDFNAKLIPGTNNILGVRIPILRNLAKELYKNKNFNTNEFLRIQDNSCMEFTMLQGFIIGLKKVSKEEFFTDIMNFVPKINNWAVCDTFCSSLKLTKKYLPETFSFLQSYLKSKNTYELRFGVVMLLTYFITDDYIDRVLKILTTLYAENYYAQMGIAWALSICYIKYFEKTHTAVSKSKLTHDIQSKAIRKVIESLRASKEEKDFLYKYIKSLQNQA